VFTGGRVTDVVIQGVPVMSLNRQLARIGATLIAAGLLALAGTGIASAHVSVHSPDQPAPGGDAMIVFRSPNESQNAATMTTLRVNFPLDTPLSNVNVEPVPGWTAKVTMTHLSTPVKMTNDTVTDAVASIVWTASTGGGVVTGQFQQFPISAEGLPTNTTQLVFTAVQTYADGTVVNWDEPTPPGGQEPVHPAPHLSLTAAGAAGASGVSATAPPAAGPMTMTSTDGTARLLAGIAVVLAGAALGFGLMRRRRPATGSGPAPDKPSEQTSA
jgi:uncharacterized protein YcnI